MCGFAGEFAFGTGQADAELTCAMAGRLRHRGPDEQGSFLSSDGRCAIGFRRLSVLDPARSHQPMSNDDGLLTLAFNGEIYNFRPLRDRLLDQGVAFRTEGDTEVLLHLYGTLGLQALDELLGMFAFAIYDTKSVSLLLARDRLGQKPLWYALLSDRIVFASQAKALLVHPKVQVRTDEKSLTAYLSIGYIPCPHSAWSGIRKLPPGSYMTVAGPQCSPKRYWSPAVRQLSSSPNDPRGAVRSVVRQSVEARMIADVPLGALLSGGVDSSIIVALMSAAAGAGGGILTFAAGFTDSDFDERPAARAVAQHCRTEHRELLIRARADDVLDQLVAMHDEPFADSSALPTWLICQAAREHVTVALTGDGGDEVFGGYDRYRALWLAETMSKPAYLAATLAGGLVRPFASGTERSWSRRLVRFVDALPLPYAAQYFRYRRLFGPADLGRLLTSEFAAQLDLEGPAKWFCDLYEHGEFDSEVTRAQHHDLLTYLPDDLLVKADIASMAVSLELRAPMLDHRVVELGLSLPVELKVARRAQKLILREAFADMLPPEVISSPKRGFGVPLARWLREDLLERLRETLLGPELRRLGIFRTEALAGLINDHVSRREDHTHRLWALLVLGRWLLTR